jgi:hypothetical protein
MNQKRNLSLLDYLYILQREYFLSDTRSKFYYNPNDKRFYKRVAGHKRDKILKIQQDNGLKTIFNDEALYSKIKSETLKPNGLPIDDLTDKDIEHYYSNGSDIKCFVSESEFVLGKIIQHDLKHNTILVKLSNGGGDKEFSCSNSVRIIPPG